MIIQTINSMLLGHHVLVVDSVVCAGCIGGGWDWDYWGEMPSTKKVGDLKAKLYQYGNPPTMLWKMTGTEDKNATFYINPNVHAVGNGWKLFMLYRDPQQAADVAFHKLALETDKFNIVPGYDWWKQPDPKL